MMINKDDKDDMDDVHATRQDQDNGIYVRVCENNCVFL